MSKVTVLIPVGPHPSYKEWLPEAVQSVVDQVPAVDEILIIDDGADLGKDLSVYGIPYAFYAVEADRRTYFLEGNVRLSYWKCPCNVGFTAAYNIGMALARNDLVVYLAADDHMLPGCIEACLKAYEEHNRKDAWYALTYELSSGDVCQIPMNSAMITKGLWKMVGGYPPAGFVGPDALVLSCLIRHAPDRIIQVEPGTPYIWIRQHDAQETKRHTWKFVPEMTSIRGKITKDFRLGEA